MHTINDCGHNEANQIKNMKNKIRRLNQIEIILPCINPRRNEVIVIIFCIIVGDLMIICLSEFTLLLVSIKFEDGVAYIL